MSLISDKAIVVGGGRGMGRAICVELAARGADVAILYRNDEAAAAETRALVEAAGRRAVAIACDITDSVSAEGAIRQAEAALGPCGILVQAAGGTPSWKPIAELDPAEWTGFLAVDLVGAFNVIRAAIPMLRRTKGTVIALSSIAAALYPIRNAQSAASKAGLEALIRVLAREEGRHGVRANVVALGLTRSAATDRTMEAWGPDTSAEVVAKIPLRRIGEPEDVARMVAFLADSDAAYVTGKVFTVDGGQHIGA